MIPRNSAFLILAWLLIAINQVLAVPCFTNIVDTSQVVECYNDNSIDKTIAMLPVVEDGTCTSYACNLVFPPSIACQFSGTTILTTEPSSLGTVRVSYALAEKKVCTATLTCTANDNLAVEQTISRDIQISAFPVS